LGAQQLVVSGLLEDNPSPILGHKADVPLALVPVQQITKTQLPVNLMAARALSISVPPTLLARADEVLE
jgi:hypothetical protein